MHLAGGARDPRKARKEYLASKEGIFDCWLAGCATAEFAATCPSYKEYLTSKEGIFG